MRPPGIVIQLDELEYLLPGLYPGVALAIEGKLPFQGLEERLHDGVAARTALAGERLDEPAILELPAKPARGVLAAPIRVNHESFSGFSLFTALSRASIARFPLMRGRLPSSTCSTTSTRHPRSKAMGGRNGVTGLSGKNSTARTPSRSGWISMRGTCVLSRHTFCPISRI